MASVNAPSKDSSFEEERCNVASLKEAIDAKLAQLLPHASGERDQVSAAMREAALAPGKRIRPLLLIIAARELGYDAPSLLDLAAAIEMVHAASLVLDDMPCMDNAQLRRGRPTVHFQYGEDVAVLASVALLSQAFRTVASVGDVAAPLRNQLVAVLAGAVGPQGLVQGQYKDLHDLTDSRREEDVVSTNELKTGVLFAAALEMAALVAGAPESVHAAFKRVAQHLGQAFQLLDDLKDSHASSETGKDSGKDLGKCTLLALLGESGVSRRLESHVGSADQDLKQVFHNGGTLSLLMAQLFGNVPAEPTCLRTPL